MRVRRRMGVGWVLVWELVWAWVCTCVGAGVRAHAACVCGLSRFLGMMRLLSEPTQRVCVRACMRVCTCVRACVCVCVCVRVLVFVLAGRCIFKGVLPQGVWQSPHVWRHDW